ncbi:MAG: hypothetical protein AAF628_30225 [Planctomycetota bacterium]
MSRARRTILRAGAPWALACATVFLLGAGRCHSYYDSQHVHGQFCHSHGSFGRHCHPHALHVHQELELRLEHYREVPSAGPGAHPIARLEDIGNVSVGSLGRRGAFTPDDLVECAARVLRDNPELIGLPADAGTLVYAGLEPDAGAGPRVRYLQVAPPALGGTALPGAGLAFEFDAQGRLLAIDVDTVLHPDRP